MAWPVTGPQSSVVVSDTVLPTASQTCTSWDASTELELASCKEDLQGWDAETIFRASTRIAKVTSQGACVGARCPGALWGIGPCSAWPCSPQSPAVHSPWSNSCQLHLNGLECVGAAWHAGGAYKVPSYVLCTPVMGYPEGGGDPRKD